MDLGDLLTLGILAAIGYIVYASVDGGTGGIVCGILNMGSFPSNWNTSGAAATYVPTLEQIGSQYGLPSGLLSAVAYQESAFNPNAVSSEGAVGMFQLMPQYYPGAGQNWQTDAGTSANALASYAGQFNDWQLALAAYNWGPTNLGSCDTLSSMPSETQKYVTRISDAIQLPGSLVG